jgi:hypothetical protein
MALGLLFYVVDFREAYVEKVGVQKTAQKIAELKLQSSKDQTTTWYVARWGFQYYAERASMKPVFPDESNLEPGDWLAISDGPAYTKAVAAYLTRFRLEPVTTLVLEDSLPVGTMLGYYSTGIPIHHQAGPRRIVQIYKVGEK